ncbi:rhodanese-related sulfurtransferase [Candidatus Lariskella endosymbiont of Hedychridium roseum]|uniref:oxygen-dependent tRNA uridine(34) hydroxylase TrhO n=1 Tax=Candidatus Lariskella endosymbiont of Hedychridium roseum TaxID=3077949 RepID=UPI0030D26E72
MEQYTVITFYKFINIENIPELQIQLLKICKKHSIKGTILIAKEGINSTLVGKENNIELFLNSLFKQKLFSDLYVQRSKVDFMPFHKLKVKTKNEIVTFREQELDIAQAGIHVEPEEWDSLLQNKEEFLVIDTRNDYEVEIGTFANSINPNIKNFTELKNWLHSLDIGHKKNIAMFCTGGIRCEKSTAYMKSLGYKNVYQLKGGIINYLAKTSNKSGMWQGACFTFDDRRALGTDLQPQYNNAHMYKRT